MRKDAAKSENSQGERPPAMSGLCDTQLGEEDSAKLCRITERY